MKRFFSFRSSSASGGGKENTVVTAADDENVHWETPEENVARYVGVGPKPQSCKSSSSPHLRRSLSLSFSTPYSGGVDGKCFSSRNIGGSPSDCANLPHQAAEGPIHCRPMTPERLLISKSCSEEAVHTSHTFEKLDSPRSSRGHHCSAGNSPYSSPVPLRCRSSRVTQSLNTNNILDLSVDGEQYERRSRRDSQPSRTRNDDCLVEKRSLPSFGRPPRAQYTAPSSPTYSKESLRSRSFREDKNVTHIFSTLNWPREDSRLAVSPKKHSRSRSCALNGQSKMKVLDNESQTTTTTVEDIYEDSSNSYAQISDHIFDDDLNRYCTEETLNFHGKNQFLWECPMGIGHDDSLCPGKQDEDVDAELVRKLNEVEKQIKVLPKLDIDFDKLWSGKLCTSGLVHMIRNLIEERKNVALELSSQIRSRISERSSTAEALKQAKIDLVTRTRRLEKEKNELQSSLEKELDRRSTDWSFKLEKFQVEEQRLRERVRELAEQNVSLQREVSSLRGKEMEAHRRILDSETRLNETTMRLEEMMDSNSKFQEALSELQVQFKAAEADHDFIKRSYREKEEEAKELQKIVAKLQTIYSEQEKTITGLKQGYVDHIGKQTQVGGDHISKLQMEHIRLTGVEQTLRKEVESFRIEVESLKRENCYILGRLRSAGSSCGLPLLRVDLELHTQIECLQNQALSLLDDDHEFCGKLLKVVNSKQCERGHGAIGECDGYSTVEFNMKLQSLRRAVKNLRGRLQSMSEILNKRTELESLGSQLQKKENDLSRQHCDTTREDEVEFQLKAETLLTRVLREKLFYREQELEQLQSELGSSVQAIEILKSEIQRLQDELSCLTHKMKDMEIQMLRKVENFNKLKHDLQECTKELTVSRDILPKVYEERDRLWEEVTQSKEINMLLDYEVQSLKKKIEVLDEDILIKEGEISILKDSLGNKQFDILYSPSTMKDALE